MLILKYHNCTGYIIMIFFIEIFENDLMNLLDKQDINFEQFFTLDENNQVILI
jgi:hypothetical protein